MPASDDDPVAPLVEHLFRREAGRLVASLTRLFGPSRLQTAEDVVQETLLKALQQWRFRGVPENPSAWLYRVARNGALDRIRQEATRDRLNSGLHHEAGGHRFDAADPALALDEKTIEDDQLRLIFTCCHPALSREQQIALTLKTLGGLSVREIAGAFFASETAIEQRLVRAKRLLRDHRSTFEVPDAGQLLPRLDAVLEVIYLIFTEGHNAHSGPELVRPELCREAIRLARLVSRHPACDQPRCHALLALLLFQASRLPARVGPDGGLILLSEQDRALWDRALIVDGFRELAAAARGDSVSRYHYEAGIASLHAIAPSEAETDWGAVLELYNGLATIDGSMVVALNRAVALSRAAGPDAGIAALEAMRSHKAAGTSHLYHAARGALMLQAGRLEEAVAAFQAAIVRAPTGSERRFLEDRLHATTVCQPTASAPKRISAHACT